MSDINEYTVLINELQTYSQKILPTVFDDSLSYLESVTRLKDIVKYLIDNIITLSQSNATLTGKYNEVLKKLDDINKFIDDYMKGFVIPDGSITLKKLSVEVINELNELIQVNLQSFAKFVSFALDDDGYFIAYIPENWQDIQFSTTENGELVLNY